MKTRLLSLAVLLALMIPAAPAVGAEKAPAPAKPILEKGASAADIARQVGKPVEVVPIESPEGKAEKWIYRRKLKETTSSVAIAPSTPGAMSTRMPNDTGTGTFQIHVPEAQYRLQRITIHQVTALLLVNDRLELAKQWTERSEAFD